MLGGVTQWEARGRGGRYCMELLAERCLLQSEAVAQGGAGSRWLTVTLARGGGVPRRR